MGAALCFQRFRTLRNCPNGQVYADRCPASAQAVAPVAPFAAGVCHGDQQDRIFAHVVDDVMPEAEHRLHADTASFLAYVRELTDQIGGMFECRDEPAAVAGALLVEIARFFEQLSISLGVCFYAHLEAPRALARSILRRG